MRYARSLLNFFHTRLRSSTVHLPLRTVVRPVSSHVNGEESKPSKPEEGEPIKRDPKKPWRDAASVMLVAPLNNSPPIFMGYLVIQRSRTSRVMPGGIAFPGGAVDPIDYDERWIQLYRNQRLDITKANLLADDARIPEIYTDDFDGQPFSKQISLRITAARETFEECGVLLCRPDATKGFYNTLPKYYSYEELEDPEIIKVWQDRIKENPAEFMTLCEELKCAPDILSMFDWSNWLTPTITPSNSRFDTMFYMVIVPNLLQVVVDKNEVRKAKWATPWALLREHALGKIRLMPPQIYEMDRLLNVESESQLQQCILLRQQFGIERYFPVIIGNTDGFLSLLPGDDLYPKSPNFTETHDLEMIDSTLEQLNNVTKNFHRIQAFRDGSIRSIINVRRHGQIYD